MKMWVQSLALLSGLRIRYCLSLGRSSDLALLFLWPRLAVAVPIQPLAWELPYAVGGALKKKKKKKVLLRFKENELLGQRKLLIDNINIFFLT